MSALPPVDVPYFYEWFKDTYGFKFNGVHHSEQHGFWCRCGSVFGHVKRLAAAHRCAFSEANMAETARRFRATLPALPDAADTVVGAAWDKDSDKFYDDDTGWSERGYEAGFAAGALWGAEWWAGHMAVCEFLSDLAALVTPRKTFFAYSPDTGFDTYATAHEAEAAACESLAGYAEDAGGTLWDGDVESVCWGEVVEQARQTSRRPVEAGENPEADEIVTYGLLP